MDAKYMAQLALMLFEILTLYITEPNETVLGLSVLCQYIACTCCSYSPTSVFTFPPWDVPKISYINPFFTFDKSSSTPIAFQKLFLYHRHQYYTYNPIFTDWPKTADCVGCGVVIAEVTSSFQSSALCSVLTAELMAILLALEKFYNLPSINSASTQTTLQARDFQILFCWLPSHVGISDNELSETAAKISTTCWQGPLPYADMKKFISHHIHDLWQGSWDPQI
ncbi:hypothetical protein AVEN_207156-1 [Araneus ventricosus]|uniref:RNase H type-1 domain-containing protein n=1 Tax=Araneus ventricosus TaxID=182803 RepID=A0A4Y2HLD8_ARAVE|nr:hypothetical protein AVEN_207156-1 [Araneus ventricosus]